MLHLVDCGSHEVGLRISTQPYVLLRSLTNVNENNKHSFQAHYDALIALEDDIEAVKK